MDVHIFGGTCIIYNTGVFMCILVQRKWITGHNKIRKDRIQHGNGI